MIKTSKNAFIVFAGDVGAKFFGFLAVIHIARVLDPENFGIITIGISVLSYAIWFSDMGLMVLGTREIAKPKDARKIQLGDILFLKLLLSTSVFIAGQAAAGWVIQNPILRDVVRVYFFCLFAEAVFMEWYYKGIQRFYPLAISRLTAGICYVAGLFLFVRSPADVTLVPVFYLGGLVMALPVVWAWKKKEDLFKLSRRPGFWMLPVLRNSFTIGAGGLFAQVVTHLPPIVIGLILSVTEAGIFGAALKVVFFALVADRVFITLYFPYIARKWSVESQKLREVIIRVLRWVILGGFFLSLSFTVFSPAIIELLFGEEYGGSALILTILSWFVALTLLNSVFSMGLIAIGKEKMYFRATLRGGAVAAVLIISFTYFFGITGTAAAVVLSEGVMIFFTYREFRESFRLPLLKLSANPAAICIFLSFIFLYFGWREIYYVPLLPAAYALLAFLFKPAVK